MICWLKPNQLWSRIKVQRSFQYSAMDSKEVNKMIRREIWPSLKERGFWKFTSRSAWRHSAHQIDVVNFQSFNSYLAERISSTTYSFGLNLGCFITVIPSVTGTERFKNEKDCLLPPEYACHFRKQLRKKIRQPELTRDDVWYIDPEGKYLVPAIQEARSLVLEEGLSWFQEFTSLDYVYELLCGDEHYVNGTWGFGGKGSPARNYLTGYVALALGHCDVAAESLETALTSTSYQQFREHHAPALALAKARSS
jgi:hypothetical protein